VGLRVEGLRFGGLGQGLRVWSLRFGAQRLAFWVLVCGFPCKSIGVCVECGEVMGVLFLAGVGLQGYLAH